MSDLLQLAGLIALTVAAWLHSPVLGVCVLGLALLVVGFYLDGVRVADVWRAARRRSPE